MPGQQIVGPGRLHARLVRAFPQLPGLAGVVGRLRQLLQRRLLGGVGPGGGRIGQRQALRPGVGQLAGGVLGVVGGQPHQGQQFKLVTRGGSGLATACQLTHRVVEDLGHCLAVRGGNQRSGGAGGTGAVVFQRQARGLPGVVGREDAGVVERARHQVAAVLRLAHGEPGGAGGGLHVLPVQVLRQQRVTRDLAVVVHAKARKLGAEIRPVAAAAQFQQPVVAQTVFDIAARPARGEGVQLGLLRFAQAVAQLPVLDPHCQRMTRHTCSGARGGECGAVFLAQGVARLHHALVAVGSCLRAQGHWGEQAGQGQR